MTARVMIVEDDVELQELYTHMLDGTGWEIEQMYDGTQALARLQETVPDALILDVVLDEMGGDVLYHEMRRQPRLADLPVVIVSVLSAERCHTLMQVDDKTRFLRKPFHRQALLEAVGWAMGRGDE
ncbi:MAG: response regulator [Anaerolineae bacterium]|nr:response regulator [Anaerolineae bacterium]